MPPTFGGISPAQMRPSPHFFLPDAPPTLTRHTKWESLHNGPIAIRDMTDTHLIAAMRIIRARDYKWRTPYFKPMMIEARNRGIEGAFWLDEDAFEEWRAETAAERIYVIQEPFIPEPFKETEI